MFRQTNTIQIIKPDGYVQVSPSSLTRAKLTAFSDLATQQLERGAAKSSKVPRGNGKATVTISTDLAHTESAKKILQWIAGNDVTNPKKLTPDALRIECFDEAVWIYRTANSLRIKRDLRGDEIRDGISEYIKQGALRFDEFASRLFCSTCVWTVLISM